MTANQNNKNARPSSIDSQMVAQFWSNEACPYFDLIMHADGKVFPLQNNGNSISDFAFMESKSWVPISAIADLDDPSKLNEGFAVICRRDYPELDLSISGGECCSSGENGFVSVCSLSSGVLIWLAFFVSSNPFDQVSVEDGEVVAHSTMNKKYYFLLQSPHSVKVSRPN